MRTVKYRNERREKILGLLTDRRRMSVRELTRQLRVTGATIRADLEALTRQNKIIRTYGGAMVPRDGVSPEPPMELRLLHRVADKQSMGRLAASMVTEGSVVALDASTTSLAVARFLRDKKSLTVFTNSIAVAAEFMDSPGVNVIMPGGTLRHESSSMVGPEALAFIGRMETDLCFVSAHGINIARGLGEVNQAETEIKRVLAGVSRKVVALVDSTKWNRVSVSYFWPLDKIDTVITDAQISKEIRDSLKIKGVQILIAH